MILMTDRYMEGNLKDIKGASPFYLYCAFYVEGGWGPPQQLSTGIPFTKIKSCLLSPGLWIHPLVWHFPIDNEQGIDSDKVIYIISQTLNQIWIWSLSLILSLVFSWTHSIFMSSFNIIWIIGVQSMVQSGILWSWSAWDCKRIPT